MSMTLPSHKNYSKVSNYSNNPIQQRQGAFPNRIRMSTYCVHPLYDLSDNELCADLTFRIKDALDKMEAFPCNVRVDFGPADGNYVDALHVTDAEGKILKTYNLIPLFVSRARKIAKQLERCANDLPRISKKHGLNTKVGFAQPN